MIIENQKYLDFYKLSKKEFILKYGIVEYNLCVRSAMYIKNALDEGKRPACYTTRNLLRCRVPHARYFHELTLRVLAIK